MRASARSVVSDDDRCGSRGDPHGPGQLGNQTPSSTTRVERPLDRHERRGGGDRQHPGPTGEGDAAGLPAASDTTSSTAAMRTARRVRSTRAIVADVDRRRSLSGVRTRNAIRAAKPMHAPAGDGASRSRAEPARPSGPILRARWGPPPTARADVASLPVSPAWSTTAPRDRRPNHRRYAVSGATPFGPRAESPDHVPGTSPALRAIRAGRGEA